MVQKSLNYR